jgi:DNA ligase D-like protein (predicted 3'-phosphoesterase)
MSERDDLSRYRQKRDFQRTGEPSGAGGGPGGDRPRFVIQEHGASSLHWDLRLEVDGVLKSWAVPRGPSTDPRERRLAMPTEDHPLDYADFEGVIPAGEYGAGTVIVWDRGPYRDLRQEKDGTGLADALAEGKVEVWLEGEKLTGGYALIRTGGGEGDRTRWLLLKMDDDHADARRNPTRTEPRSVLSGRTRQEVAAQEGGDAGDQDDQGSEGAGGAAAREEGS